MHRSGIHGMLILLVPDATPDPRRPNTYQKLSDADKARFSAISTIATATPDCSSTGPLPGVSHGLVTL